METDAALVRRHRALLAPGTPLRDGLERILHGRTGALVVLGSPPEVEALCTGGFLIDVEFTPTALRELAKMDGAIVLSSDFERILRAGVHLVPDGLLPTVETGTRHRTADRVARQTGVPAVTVSSSMSTIALFLGGERHAIEPSGQILGRANQALGALARYRERLTALTRNLSTLEVQDAVTVTDLVRVLQCVETLRRLDAELRGYVAALGIDGRLVELQLFDLTAGLDDQASLLERDYQPDGEAGSQFRLSNLAELQAADLLDLGMVMTRLGFGNVAPDGPLSPRGHRQLAQLVRLPASAANRLVDHFGSFQAILGSDADELQQVLGERRARVVRDGLAHLTDTL